jgi:hypothetical protein
MSRKNIFLVFVCYFAVALAFGLFTELNTSIEVFDFRYSGFDGRVVGVAVVVYVLAGVLPSLYWASDRFRAEKAARPLFAWGFIGVVFMLIYGATTVSERKSDTSHLAASIAGVTDIDHDAFVKSTTTGCIKEQRKSRTGSQSGETEKQIVRYCECFTGAMDKEVTADEIVSLKRNGTASASYQEKAGRIAPTCRRSAYGQ